MLTISRNLTQFISCVGGKNRGQHLWQLSQCLWLNILITFSDNYNERLSDPKKLRTQLSNQSFGNRNLVGIKSKSNMAWLEIENGHIEGRHNATGKKGRVFVYTRKRGSWTYTTRTENKILTRDRVIWRASLEIPHFFMENYPPPAQMCLRTHPILPTPQVNLSSLLHRIDGVCRGVWRSKNWLVYTF